MNIRQYSRRRRSRTAWVSTFVHVVKGPWETSELSGWLRNGIDVHSVARSHGIVAGGGEGSTGRVTMKRVNTLWSRNDAGTFSPGSFFF
jgi:hypothetical protein